MAVGDIEMEDDKHGSVEVDCLDCVAITGEINPSCGLCDGDGVVWELITLDDDVEAALVNIFSEVLSETKPN